MVFTFFQTAKCKEPIQNILFVGGSGPANYTSIQNAIDNASNGDTVFIYNGTYYENIIVNKTINIVGESKENTIVTGNVYNLNQDFFTVFHVLADQVKISGLTVTNNIEYDTPEEYYFGVGMLIQANNTTITNNTISNISGTAIQLTYLTKNNTIFYNDFINNTENANDSGKNIWDNGKHGNYWDDYKGPDKNNDGIGDTPYNITNGNNKDNYPLMMPYDGTFRLKDFYVDYTSVFTMLLIGMIIVIIFLIPIAYLWNKKNKF